MGFIFILFISLHCFVFGIHKTLGRQNSQDPDDKGKPEKRKTERETCALREIVKIGIPNFSVGRKSQDTDCLFINWREEN